MDAGDVAAVLSAVVAAGALGWNVYNGKRMRDDAAKLAEQTRAQGRSQVVMATEAARAAGEAEHRALEPILNLGVEWDNYDYEARLGIRFERSPAPIKLHVKVEGEAAYNSGLVLPIHRDEQIEGPFVQGDFKKFVLKNLRGSENRRSSSRNVSWHPHHCSRLLHQSKSTVG